MKLINEMLFEKRLKLAYSCMGDADCSNCPTRGSNHGPAKEQNTPIDIISHYRSGHDAVKKYSAFALKCGWISCSETT